jgi:5-dehydro-4-deoxyglucarate dehydratase
MARDWNRLTDLMNRFVNPLYALRERARGYEVAQIKEAMEMLGMPAGPVRPPLMASRPKDLEDLRHVVEAIRKFNQA